jgi:hypothetical protein
MAESRPQQAPRFDTLEAFQEFWDDHDVTDFRTRDAEFSVSLRHVRNLVSIDPSVMAKVQAAARVRGVGAQTLVNLWLAEKVAQPGGR